MILHTLWAMKVISLQSVCNHFWTLLNFVESKSVTVVGKKFEMSRMESFCWLQKTFSIWSQAWIYPEVTCICQSPAEQNDNVILQNSPNRGKPFNLGLVPSSIEDKAELGLTQQDRPQKHPVKLLMVCSQTHRETLGRNYTWGKHLAEIKESRIAFHPIDIWSLQSEFSQVHIVHWNCMSYS